MAGDDSGAGDAAQAGQEAAQKGIKAAKELGKDGAAVGKLVASGGTDVKSWARLAKRYIPPIIIFVILCMIGFMALIFSFFGGGAATASTCTDGNAASAGVLATNGPVNVGSSYTYPSKPPSQGTISAEMMGNAQTIVRVARQRVPPAPDQAIVIALATALVESKLINSNVATDHDSLGLFQQRPSQGWGSPAQVTDPAYATNIFLDRLLGVQGWNTIFTPGGAAQKVQRSAFPDRYDAVIPTAAGLLQSISPVIGTTASPVSAPSPGTPNGVSKAYILGDSITYSAKDAYQQVFMRQGASTTISAVNGRSWITPGNPSISVGTTGTGKQAVTTDAQAIKEATIIVVALGTNGGITMNPPDEIVDTFRFINPTAPIYWVNVASTASGIFGYVVPLNQKLEELDTAGKINVVDWAAVVDPGGPGTNDPAHLLSDGVHPTNAGILKLAAAVESTFTSLQGINPGQCTGYATGNGGDPSNCPPDTFFNQTTLRGPVSAHDLCVKSVQQARSPEAGKAIIWAFHHVGIPYGRPDGVCSSKTTRTGPDHYDCSGFTTSAYKDTGTDVGGNPTTSTMRGNWPQAMEVTEANARPGDLLLPSTGHVVMILADNMIIHTNKCGDVSHIRTKYPGSFMKYYAIKTPTMAI